MELDNRIVGTSFIKEKVLAGEEIRNVNPEYTFYPQYPRYLYEPSRGWGEAGVHFWYNGNGDGFDFQGDVPMPLMEQYYANKKRNPPKVSR